MQLSSQQLGEVITALQRSAGACFGNERRRFTRIGVQGRLHIITADDEAHPRSCTVLLRDISMGGVGIFQSSPAVRGAKLIVGLPFGDKELLILSEAGFVQSLADNLYAVGVQFKKEVDQAYIADLLKKGEDAARISQSVLA